LYKYEGKALAREMSLKQVNKYETVLQICSRSASRNPSSFMEPGGSLTCLQGNANGPYPKPGESSPHPHNLLH